ncbi:MAG: hypothetical protein ACLRMZ_01200 [Blautia marasmi]
MEEIQVPCKQRHAAVLGSRGRYFLILQTLLLFSDLKPWEFVANVVVLIFGLAYAYFRKKSGKVHMEVSYEEA